MADLTYPKSVRLHHRKAFQTLLDKGSTHYNAVFKVYWLRREAESAEGCDAGGCRFAVSVPKRSFKRAVKRNLLKRRTREAIRLNRSLLPEGLAADFLFFYRAPEVCDYAAIEKAVMETFEAVAAKVAAPADPATETPLFVDGSIDSHDPSTETPLFVDGSDNQDGSHE